MLGPEPEAAEKAYMRLVTRKSKDLTAQEETKSGESIKLDAIKQYQFPKEAKIDDDLVAELVSVTFPSGINVDSAGKRQPPSEVSSFQFDGVNKYYI